jgi:hypothetical protein
MYIDSLLLVRSKKEVDKRLVELRLAVLAADLVFVRRVQV